MTIMPDVIAKTRIFAEFDRLFAAASDSELREWQSRLGPSYLLGDLMIDLKQSGALKMDAADVEHIVQHAFGRASSPKWWQTETEAIATEGFAWAIELMFRELAGPARPERLPLDTLWLCPATYAFRLLVSESPHQVTAIILTPPKPDHPKHYAEYQKRLLDRPVPEEDDVPPDYDKREPMVAITAQRDAVWRGRSGRIVGERQPLITQVAEVEAVVPLAERY
jgi:hypothetical protein